MTAAKVTETLVTAGDNSFSVDYSNPDDQTTRSAVTSGFKPFSIPVSFGENTHPLHLEV